MSDAIVIKGVRKAFGQKVAVDDMDLVVPQGALYGFIGPNGAGKTTTIRIVMSIIFPDRGEVSVLGKRSAVESKDRIGYLPEERGLYRKMRVGPFLAFMARLKGIDGPAATRQVKEWLHRVGLADCFRKRCEELSKGMQQKVQFIAAVLHKPDLLILDEPFSGLDPVNRRLLRELIDEQHRAGRTIIFSTHAMYEAEQLCDHLVMINRGKKVLDIAMRDLWKRFDPRTVIVEPLEHHDGASVAALSGIPGVAGAHETRTGFDLKLADDADPAAVMSSAAARVRARRVELKRVSVEEVFIDLVQQSGGSGEEIAEIRSAIEQARAEAGAGVSSGEAG
ncbi:MAG: ATP-binding cassette domain-containing protein [Phycisphaerae bacterium]|nr:ATP-binding cassette domain-containing protein [Phycisphaerae bacterium]